MKKLLFSMILALTLVSSPVAFSALAASAMPSDAADSSAVVGHSFMNEVKSAKLSAIESLKVGISDLTADRAQALSDSLADAAAGETDPDVLRGIIDLIDLIKNRPTKESGLPGWLSWTGGLLITVGGLLGHFLTRLLKRGT